MAKSGQIKTNTEYESYFWVNWEEQSQDIAANKTVLLWSCGVYCGHNFELNAIRMSAVSINGVTVYGGGTYSYFYRGDHQIAKGTLEISHNTDGTKTIQISSFTGWLYANHNYSSNGGSVTLTTIPRKATITAASDFTDLDNPSISFSNPGGFPMEVWLEPNPNGDHLCRRQNIPNTGSYTWVLTDAERDALRSKCAGNSCIIRIGIYTNINGVEDADYRDKTYIMTENAATKPVVSMSVSLNNGSLSSAFSGLYIQGKSRVNVTLSAVGKYNASIQSYSATVDGKTYSSSKFTSDAIQKAGSVKIIGYANDSRKFTGSAEQTVNVVAYSKPLVIPLGSENAIQCYRSDGNGNRVGNSTSLWIKAKRSYTSVNGKNGCALQWRWKPVAEAWSNSAHPWSNLITKTNTATNEYNALVTGEFDLKKAYTVQIRAIDDIGEHDVKTFEIPTQDVALHLGSGGKNVSVGTYCDYSEDYLLDVLWNTRIRGELRLTEEGVPLKDFVIEQGASDDWTWR